MSFFRKNEKYFVRTVTMHLVGLVVDINETELLLKDASWVADSGRFNNALTTGELNEVEPFPLGEVIVSRGSIVDACVWKHNLPTEVK